MHAVKYFLLYKFFIYSQTELLNRNYFRLAHVLVNNTNILNVAFGVKQYKRIEQFSTNLFLKILSTL